jgi:hypothetical protein
VDGLAHYPDVEAADNLASLAGFGNERKMDETRFRLEIE